MFQYGPFRFLAAKNKLRYLVAGYLFLGCPFAFAGSLLEAKRVEGKVYLLSSKNSEPQLIKEGDSVGDGDKVEVESASRILLSDADSQFWLGSNSSVTINAGKAVENTSNSKKVVSLLKGNLRVKIQSGQGSKFEVRSKTAVAGVRGTEFFFANEKENVTFCVLEGNAWIQDEKSGEKFDVKEGAGVVLFADGSVKKTFTAEQVKFDWIAMTAFSEERRVTENFYSQDPDAINFGKYFSYRYALTGMARNYLNRDYNNKVADGKDNMYHGFFTPTLIFNSPVKFQLTPRMFINKSDKKIQWDELPATSETFRRGFNLQEAFAGFDTERFSVKAGLFQLVWPENALFQARPWMQEGLVHHGAQVSYLVPLEDTQLKIEAVVTKHLNEDDLHPLNGRNTIGMKALRLTEAKDRITVTVLERDSGNFVNTKSMYYRTGNKVQEGIINLKNTYSLFDFNLNYGYQKVQAFRNTKVFKEKKVLAQSFDGALGFALPAAFRTQMRYIYAGPNYVPGVEDYYEMGFIGRTFHTNIRQKRILLERAFGDDNRVRLEFMNSRAAANSIFSTYQTAGKPLVRGRLMSDETNLSWVSSWNKSFQTFFAIWYWDGGEYLTNNDPARGATLGFRLTQ